jgi:hypothetical protein
LLKKTEVLRFEAELLEELTNIKRIVGIIKSRVSSLPALSTDTYEAYIDSIAHNLENFYLAVEEIFKMICVATEEGLPEGERWHSILLKNMTKEIKGVRPSVISMETYEMMDDYRKFRHLARNIYTFNILPEKVLILAKTVSKSFKGIDGDIKEFVKFMLKVTD